MGSDSTRCCVELTLQLHLTCSRCASADRSHSVQIVVALECCMANARHVRSQTVS